VVHVLADAERQIGARRGTPPDQGAA